MIKLQAIHLIEDDVYIINKPNDHTYLQIAGHIVDKPGQFVVSNSDEVKIVIKPSPKIIHYVNETTKEIISPEEYKDTLNLLNSKSDEDGIFSDLEDEYNYRKFIQEWIPVKEEPEFIFESVEFEIIEIRKNSGDPDIVSLWNSQNVIDKNKALFTLNRLSVAKKFLTELCAKNRLILEIPTHSGLLYAKINGNYMTRNKLYKFENPIYIGTLEECKKEKEKVFNEIKECVDIILLTSVELTNVGEVLSDLQNICYTLNNHKVSKNDIEQARVGLMNLIKKIRSQVE